MGKNTLSLCIVSLLLACLSRASCVWSISMNSSTIIVPDQYSTIQEAINNAVDGDTIFVKAGTYLEHVVVNKTLSLVGEDVSTTIIDGNKTGHIVEVVSNNVSITGFTVQNSGSIHSPDLDAGICLNGTTGCTISENRLVGNGFAGISLLNSNQNTITRNNLSSAGWGGIHLLSSSRNMVSGNIIADKYGGVNGHVSSDYNNITENVISNCTYGMFYHAANYNNICKNNISTIAVEGIWLQDQVNYNVVAENSLINNTVAIRLQGPNYNNTLSNNVITGAEYGIKIQNYARYTRIADNIIANNRAGNDSWSAGIRLDSGMDCQIHSNMITGNCYGILLYSSSPHVSIDSNNITENEFAVRVASGGSNYLNVSDNVVMNNRGYGIGLTGFGGASNYATITRNLIVNNSDGIALGQYSNHNRVSHNNISMNDFGFYIESSAQNSIYGNNVLNNVQQAYVASGSLNSWDDGYPSGGNYWEDYAGNDAYSGDYQNETGSDWIGDSPYVVDQNDTDRYPLMHPFSPQTNAIEVGYRELLDKCNGLDSQFSSLNSSYYELLKNYTDLRTEFTNQTNAINTLNQSYSTLNFNCTQLNTAYGTLENLFETLNSDYNNLRNDYNALQQSYNSLNSTFTDNKQSVQNELDFTRNLVCVFIGATAVLIVTTIYVAPRKPKTKPET